MKLSAIFHLLSSAGKRSLLLSFPVLGINSFAALLEGLSFAFLLLAFSSLAQTGASSPFPDFFIKWFPEPTFTLCFTFAIGSQILRSSCNYLGQIGTTRLGTKIQIETQRALYRQILSFSFPCAHRYSVGDFVEHIKTASSSITNFFDYLNRIVVSIFGILASLGVMFFLSPSLASIALILFGALGLSQKWIIANLSRQSQKLAKHSLEFSKHIVQTLNGLRVIHTFHRQNEMVKRLSCNLSATASTSRKLCLWNHAILPVNEILGVLIVGIFLFAGNLFPEAHKKDLFPLLLTFITILYRLNTRIQVLVSTLGGTAIIWGHLTRLQDVLSPEGKEFLPQGGKPFLHWQHSISFSCVEFQYPRTHRPALRGISFSVEKGEVVAFVGSSGAGKSSIIDLLLRLYEPTKGAIFIDGENLAQYNLESWRDRLGVVSQDIILFPASIEENIRFGRPEASFEDLVKAAKLAGAHEFIDGLEQKYQTLLGENGYRLSGGEKQRITLARALVKDPDIFVLDEATSHLDSRSERLIQTAVEQLKGEKTVFLVAHRLSTIQNADKIFVLEKGEIIETGSHQTLLELQGKYAHLWEIQSKKEYKTASV